jgi:hypothetical protein
VFVFHPTVTDNVGLTKLEGLVNGKLLGGGCPISAGRTLCKLTLSSVPDDTDATITLRASDAAGNQSEKSSAFTWTTSPRPEPCPRSGGRRCAAARRR